MKHVHSCLNFHASKSQEHSDCIDLGMEVLAGFANLIKVVLTTATTFSNRSSSMFALKEPVAPGGVGFCTAELHLRYVLWVCRSRWSSFDSEMVVADIHPSSQCSL